MSQSAFPEHITITLETLAKPVSYTHLIDAFDGTVILTKKDGKIDTDFDDITLNASVENTRIYKGNAGFTSIEDGEEITLVPYNRCV